MTQSQLKLKLWYDWQSVGQNILVSSPHLGLKTSFYYCQLLMWGALSDERTVTVSDSRLPHPGGPGPRIYVPQNHGGPVISLGTWFPFRRLLWLAGLWCRYSNPPPRGSKSKSKLLYDWPFTANQFVLAPCPLRPTTRDFFQLNFWGNSHYVVGCGWVHLVLRPLLAYCTSPRW
jgi:hypothetical protein